MPHFAPEHYLLPFLDTLPHLKWCFGADSVVVPRAPIDESGSRDLYAVVMWAGQARAAMQALDQFEANWRLATSQPAAGYLNFTYVLA
jgi:hypothetical protein